MKYNNQVESDVFCILFSAILLSSSVYDGVTWRFNKTRVMRYPPLLTTYRGPRSDGPDSRDYIYKPTNKLSGRGVDLRGSCPPAYNQEYMRSCNVHAVAGAFEFDVKKQGLPLFSPSRLFIWYHARDRPHDRTAVPKDLAVTFKEAIQTLNKGHGVCSEHDWHYEASRSDKKTFKVPPNAKAARKPSFDVEKHARQHTALRYWLIPDEGRHNSLIKYLDERYPFLFAMDIYGLLYNGTINENNHYTIRLPTDKDKNNKKYKTLRHSLLAVGHNPQRKVFIIRNSWGANWGDQGYFYAPYNYLKHHCDSFWTICTVKSLPDEP
ncbi:hypothetical protein F4781DRAFT_279438 [Annulohypoxylon bovei var. microspora]|nr:hypothetical protein F4781DRAFT_279438 [Annulohypoxylon bovei var. microspora]